MVDAKAAAALVVGVALVAIGGIGALVVLLGTLAGAMAWSGLAWLLLALFVGGAGLTTYAGVVLASDLLDAIAGGGLGDLTDQVDLDGVASLLD